MYLGELKCGTECNHTHCCCCCWRVAAEPCPEIKCWHRCGVGTLIWRRFETVCHEGNRPQPLYVMSHASLSPLPSPVDRGALDSENFTTLGWSRRGQARHETTEYVCVRVFPLSHASLAYIVNSIAVSGVVWLFWKHALQTPMRLLDSSGLQSTPETCHFSFDFISYVTLLACLLFSQMWPRHAGFCLKNNHVF